MPTNDDLQVTDERPAEVRAISPVYLQSTRALPGLSDRELVDELLRFANTGGGVARSLLESGARWASDAHLEELRGERLFSRDWLELEAEQLEVREALAKIAARGVAAPLLALWRRRAAGLVLLPTFEPDGTRRYRHAPFERFASGVQPPLAYALLLCGAFRGQLCAAGGMNAAGFSWLLGRPSPRPTKAPRLPNTAQAPITGNAHIRSPRRNACAGVERRAKARANNYQTTEVMTWQLSKHHEDGRGRQVQPLARNYLQPRHSQAGMAYGQWHPPRRGSL